MEIVRIVGMGDDGAEGLTSAARRVVEQAEVLIGPEALLRAAPNSGAQHVAVGAELDDLVGRIEGAAGKRVVVLASGDPLFYGVARYLAERLGKDRCEVLPNVSTMQTAFARVMESWDEAYLTNLANQPLEQVVERVRVAEKVGVFTSDAVPPSVLARELLDRRIDYFQAYVCENLGSPDERVTRGELAEIAAQTFAPLNVMILVRRGGAPDRPAELRGKRLFGNPDDAFLQSRPKHGLLTPAEVRCMALAELDLGAASVVWDIGAGSGSVAIEAARIAREGRVFAIEMDAEDYQLIIANAERFGVANLEPVLGAAPDAWADLPAPDAVFVGGTGRMVTGIVEQALERLKPGGRIVVNVGSVENVAGVHALLSRETGDANCWMINLSRGLHQFERLRFEALNPTFVVGAVKKP